MIDITKVPKQVLYILKRLDTFGWSGFLVGGAVRNLLLNREVSDWDLASDCPLEEIRNLFPATKIVGVSFGVALVHIDGMDIQIARFRTDGRYSDGRHPDSVEFVNDIMEDLKRRDFRINAMAWNHYEFVCVDGALDDLKNGIIRSVGNPEERFKEDALRILRLVRFSCQLNFEIDNQTAKAAIQLSNLVQNISLERINEELSKILMSEYPEIGIIKLQLIKVLNYIIPELTDCISCFQNNFHKFDVYGHILETLYFIPNDLSLRLAALLHDIGKPQTKSIDENGNIHFYGHEEISANMAEEIMRRLKYNNDTINEVKYLVAHHMELMNYENPTNRNVRRLLNRHGESRLKKLIEFYKADLLGSGTRDQNEVEILIKNFRNKLEEVLQEKSATRFEDLVINGNDIIEVTGLKPGKNIGIIKSFIMKIVLDNPELNQREKLLNIVRQMNICKFDNIKYMKDDKNLNNEEISEIEMIINLMDEATFLQNNKG